MLSSGDAHYVGHNLDDYYSVEGMIVANRRGIAKESISWRALDPRCEADAEAPKAHWVSRYGSVTGNTFGREFIDGGMNEAGLCISEMTLMGTAWPEDDLPKIYHHLWMQYLLDNFDSVEDVVGSLDKLSISGHCQWHFFVADLRGSAAVIEFPDGKRTVYRGGTMPVKVLCNAAYASELEKMRGFRGYGGDQDLGMGNKEVDNRFVWAASLIDGYPASGSTDPVVYCFDILRELDCGPTQWSLVYGLTHGRMYFRTAHAQRIRYADVASFDLSCGSEVAALDIHRDLEGDVSHCFEPYSEDDNRAFIVKALEPVDTSSLGEDFKPGLCDHLAEYAKGFTCP
jgi:penicillin V acylase-like amidase (Ntn superfamily)